MLKSLNTPKHLAILLLFTCALLSLNTTLAQTKKDILIVFVGEKISVVEDPEELSFNRRFRAKYRILEMVHGSKNCW